MSDSQAYEEVTVSSDGVTVVKRFEEEFPVPAIAFEFYSDRDKTVTVRLRDGVPENVAVEDLGFHPEYGSEHWTIEDEEITFERELEAGADYTTVYGIRATGADDIERFLTDLSIEEVDPPLPEDATTGADDSGIDDVVPGEDDAVKDAIAGDGEVPGLENTDDDTEEVETLDLNDPTSEGTASAGGTATAAAGSDANGAAETDGAETEATAAEDDAVAVEGSLAASLAEEIRENEVSAEDVKLLRRALELAGEEDSGSRDARIERLQSDVADLRAYTDSLETFLDENGTGDEVVEEAREKVAEFETRLEEFDETIAEMESQVEETVDTVDSVEGEVETVRDDLAGVETDVDDVSGDVSELSGSVEDLEGAVDDLKSEIEAVREEAADGEVEDRLDDIKGEIEDLREWQDQIKQIFGG